MRLIKKSINYNQSNMKNWLSKNLNSIIIGSFLIPILLVAFVSISHVTTFYNLANPITWAAYLSVAVEVAALAALAGVSAKFGRFIYIPFGIVTFIQLLGNFFFSYTWININSKEFKDWMEMVGPLLEPLGVDSENPTSHRTLLAFFTGGLLPFISLTFAHMLIVYSNKIKGNSETTEEPEKEMTEDKIEQITKEAGKIEKEIEEEHKPYSPTEDDLKKLKEIFEKQYKVSENEDVVNNTEPLVDGISEPTSEPIPELTPEPTPEPIPELTPEPTPEPIYFVDDEPVVEETPSINRLVYTKNE